MGFSEPWDWSDHALSIEVDDPTPTDWPILGRVVTCSWDDSLIGRAVELSRRHVGDETALDHFPIVSVAVSDEDTAHGWRGLGFGTLSKVKDPGPRPPSLPPTGPSSPWP
jgi:hypothetical protein